MKKTLTAALVAALSLVATTAAAENIGAFCRGIHATSEFISKLGKKDKDDK